LFLRKQRDLKKGRVNLVEKSTCFARGERVSEPSGFTIYHLDLRTTYQVWRLFRRQQAGQTCDLPCAPARTLTVVSGCLRCVEKPNAGTRLSRSARIDQSGVRENGSLFIHAELQRATRLTATGRRRTPRGLTKSPACGRESDRRERTQGTGLGERTYARRRAPHLLAPPRLPRPD